MPSFAVCYFSGAGVALLIYAINWWFDETFEKQVKPSDRMFVFFISVLLWPIFLGDLLVSVFGHYRQKRFARVKAKKKKEAEIAAEVERLLDEQENP